MNATHKSLLVCLAAAAFVGTLASTMAAQQSGEQVPLPIKLPRAVFAGTHPDLTPDQLARIEKPSNKPRPIPMVPKGTINLALHKKVTSSTPPVAGPLDKIVDGNKEATEEAVVELKPKLQWVQIDLGSAANLQYIALWHYHSEPVVFHSVVVQVSNDPLFLDGVVTLFNNDQDNASGLGIGKDREYFESSEGRLVDAKNTKARYVRLYSKGSTYRDPLNRYTEVEVYGVPAK